MLAATDVIIVVFTATNCLRIAAYLPQILRLARDDSGAAAVSCCTWFIFLISNISTGIYAAMVLNDRQMAVIFLANAICSGVILILALVRRRRPHPHVRG
jgi:hypothetical protein